MGLADGRATNSRSGRHPDSPVRNRRSKPHGRAVLDSFYDASCEQVAEAIRSLLAFPSIVCVDPALLLRAVEAYEVARIDFAEAYPVACAEATGVRAIASFNRALDRITTIDRVEPPGISAACAALLPTGGKT